MAAFSTPAVPETTLNDFYTASANARSASRPQSAGSAPADTATTESLVYSLGNTLKYGENDEEQISFLAERMERQILAIGSLKTHLEDLSSDPFTSSGTNKNGRPTVPVLSSRLDSLEDAVSGITQTCISIADNSLETMVYMLDHLRRSRRSGRGTAVGNEASGPATTAVQAHMLKHYTHYMFALLVGRTHKPVREYADWVVPPLEDVILEGWPNPEEGNENGLVTFVLESDEDGQEVTEDYYRPDWLNARAPASKTFLKKIRKEIAKHFTTTDAEGKKVVHPPQSEINAAIETYWATVAGNYKMQENIDDAHAKGKLKNKNKTLGGRRKHIAKSRYDKFALGPLTQATHKDWYLLAFLKDKALPEPILCPVYLSADNLPTGPRYAAIGDASERDYWVHRALGRFASEAEAWEVVHVWWASEELRTVGLIQDAYIRQSGPNQKLYWSGPRSKWRDIHGDRSLPVLKNDPRDKAGHAIYSWMVDQEHVKEVFGPNGEDWCSRLLPNPPFTPPTRADEPREILKRPEFKYIKNLFDSWADHISLDGVNEGPSVDDIRMQLEAWNV